MRHAMKLSPLLAQYTADILAIANHYGITFTTADMTTMYQLLYEARANRAYDDNHPRYETRARVLPFDGSDYCEFYKKCGEANDSHVKTLLAKILAKLQA